MEIDHILYEQLNESRAEIARLLGERAKLVAALREAESALQWFRNPSNFVAKLPSTHSRAMADATDHALLRELGELEPSQD